MAKNPFTSKLALLTGAASGIGAALGKELAHAGAEVVLADRQADLAERVAGEIRAGGGRASAVELEVRSVTAFERVVRDVVARQGSVDYLFNNAGIGVGGEMDTYAAPDWDDVIDVNLRGVAYGIQAVYPVMVRQGFGHIVNTASMAGLVATPGQGSYTATKHAVVALSKALRVEARHHGVRVSVLCPGVIRTPMLSGGKFGRLNYVGIGEEQMRALWQRLRPMDVDVFARKALAAIARDQAIIVLPRWWKAFWYIDRLSPALSHRLWRIMLDRSRAEFAQLGAKPAARAAKGEVREEDERREAWTERS